MVDLKVTSCLESKHYWYEMHKSEKDSNAWKLIWMAIKTLAMRLYPSLQKVYAQAKKEKFNKLYGGFVCRLIGLEFIKCTQD